VTDDPLLTYALLYLGFCAVVGALDALAWRFLGVDLLAIRRRRR
jgi:hypothetical protein